MFGKAKKINSVRVGYVHGGFDVRLVSVNQSLETGKLGANAMKRVSAGAHLLTPRLFVPAKRPGDRADYCLDCSFLP